MYMYYSVHRYMIRTFVLGPIGSELKGSYTVQYVHVYVCLCLSVTLVYFLLFILLHFVLHVYVYTVYE